MSYAINYFLGDVLGVDLTTRFGGALQFFVQDSVKVQKNDATALLRKRRRKLVRSVL